jgi:hypothetical protein
MSAVSSGRFSLPGADYLIRVDADLSGTNLQIRDIDVHVLVSTQNQDGTQLTSGEALVGKHHLQIEAFDDGRATHRFLDIEFGGRVAIRTPQAKLALLRFRYAVKPGPNDTVQVGWANITNGVSSIKVLYPAKHAEGTLYPSVHLEKGAAVHQFNLFGPTLKGEEKKGETPSGLSFPEEEQKIAYEPRQLLRYVVEDHPEDNGGIWPAKLGLDSFRTNSCRWLAMIAQQDAHWRAKAAGTVSKVIEPIDLAIMNPDGTSALNLQKKKKVLKLRLESMAGGQLVYSEASGAMAKLTGLLTVDNKQEDRWELYDGSNIQSATLGPISLAQLSDVVPLTGHAVGLAGLKLAASGPKTTPVERIILKFGTPHLVDDGKKIEDATDIRVAMTSLLT